LSTEHDQPRPTGEGHDLQPINDPRPGLRNNAPVVVLGMHRNGTSLCSHLLRTLGIDMGDDEVAYPSNRKREWERLQTAEGEIARLLEQYAAFQQLHRPVELEFEQLSYMLSRLGHAGASRILSWRRPSIIAGWNQALEAAGRKPPDRPS
jgi:hypothetical protein